MNLTITAVASAVSEHRSRCISAERTALYRARRMRFAAVQQSWDPAAAERYNRRADALIGAVLARRAGRLAGTPFWSQLGDIGV